MIISVLFENLYKSYRYVLQKLSRNEEQNLTFFTKKFSTTSHPPPGDQIVRSLRRYGQIYIFSNSFCFCQTRIYFCPVKGSESLIKMIPTSQA